MDCFTNIYIKKIKLWMEKSGFHLNQQLSLCVITYVQTKNQ